MSIEMQRLVLKEILDKLQNYDRILNKDYDELNTETCRKLSHIHTYLLNEDTSVGLTNMD